FAFHFPQPTLPAPAPFSVAGALIFAGGWLGGSLIMGAYLFVSLNLFGRHSNEAFSSLACEDYKNFLRLKIEPDGKLTIFPIGIRRVARRWKDRPEGAGGPELVPDDSKATAPELIEEPIYMPKELASTFERGNDVWRGRDPEFSWMRWINMNYQRRFVASCESAVLAAPILFVSM